jgi:hypothetical protein
MPEIGAHGDRKFIKMEKKQRQAYDDWPTYLATFDTFNNGFMADLLRKKSNFAISRVAAPKVIYRVSTAGGADSQLRPMSKVLTFEYFVLPTRSMGEHVGAQLV